MHKLLFAFLFFVIALACKNKNAPGTSPAIKGLVERFSEVSLPYSVVDSNVAKKSDTATISYAVFTEVIPDTVLINEFGKKSTEVQIKPVGKIQKENEIYILANFFLNKKATLIAFALDKKNKYLSHLKLLKQDNKDNYIYSVSVTTEPTFIISKEKLNANRELSYTRNGYAYNNGSGNFIAVLNDSNEDLKRISEIINPIDTLPNNNKYSGDYTKDKRNFISVRDGNTTNRYIFFIHFEKDKGNCIGELKGTMTLRDATHAYYQQSGDPCVIDFVFNKNGINVKEQGNCGNRRGMRCFFDDSYQKKKENKSKPTK